MWESYCSEQGRRFAFSIVSYYEVNVFPFFDYLVSRERGVIGGKGGVMLSYVVVFLYLYIYMYG